MKAKVLPALIMLVAGALICIIDIINKVGISTSLARLLVVMVAFYIIGLIARAIINKVILVKADETQEDETQEVKETGVSGQEALSEVKAAPAEVKK